MGFLSRLFSNPDPLPELRREQRFLQNVIGAWPPKIGSPERAREIFERWSKATEGAENLHHDRPHDLELLVLFADLLRMGHNLNVRGAADTCYQIFNDVLKRQPNHVEANYKFACFCLSGGGAHEAGEAKRQAALAEKHLFMARRSAEPRVVPGVSQALGHACIMQGKLDEAIRHFETHLVEEGDSPEVLDILTHLKSGAQPTLHFSPGPGTDRAQSSEAAGFSPDIPGLPDARKEYTFPSALGTYDVNSWVQGYYQNPRPGEVPEILLQLRGGGILRIEEFGFQTLGLLAELFAGHPDRVPVWVPDLHTYEDEDLAVMLRALWLSGTPSGRALLDRVGEERIRRIVPHVLQAPPPRSKPVSAMMVGPGVLDYHWSRFFVSGDKASVREVIDHLPGLEEFAVLSKSRDVHSEAYKRAYIGVSAYWSLGANAKRHPLVREALGEEVPRRPKEVRETLARILQSLD